MEPRKLDVRGAKCPMPVVQAKKAMDAMAPGELLEVTATDPGSMPDFVGWAKTSRLAVLREQRRATDETGREVFIHVIERKA
jgi:TusA-related sulfurtransferase